MIRLVAICFVVFAVFNGLATAVDTDTFLQQFGYIAPIPESSSAQHSPAARRAAIRLYQEKMGLQVTGEINQETVEMMSAPRCGMPDFTQSNRPAAYSAPGMKWQKTNLKYYIQNYTPDMSRTAVKRAIRNGYGYWSAVAPLQFSETTRRSSADMQLAFASGDHGDGQENVFDGSSGTLAHAYFPEDGRLHFDEAETWTERTSSGVNLEIVAAHEIGHSLGLAHSFQKGALMFPSYQGYNANFRLHRDDIDGIRSLYGARRGTTARPRTTRRPRVTTRRPRVSTGRPRVTTRRPRVTTRRPRVTPRPTRRPTNRPRYCNTQFDSVMLAPNGNTLGFRYGYVYNIPDNRHTTRTSLRRFFPRGPTRVHAAVYSRTTRSYILIHGNYGYRFSSSRRLVRRFRFPRSVRSVQAAVMWHDGNIILWTGSHFYAYNERMNRVNGPFRVSSYFRGVPSSVDGAMVWKDRYMYLFKGANYYKVNPYRRTLMNGYPKTISQGWFKCGSRVSRLGTAENALASSGRGDPESMPLTPRGGWRQN